MDITKTEFEQIDKDSRFSEYETKLKVAKANGYDFVSEAYYMLHFDKKVTIAKLSEMFGYTRGNIANFFKRRGWKTLSKGWKLQKERPVPEPAKYDFEALDEYHLFAYKHDKIKKARDLGYESIHEALWKLYHEEDLSFTQIAPLMDYQSGVALSALFRRRGWKARSKGGANHKNIIAGDKARLKIRFDEEVKSYKDLDNYCKKIASEYRCSYHSVRSLVFREGWVTSAKKHVFIQKKLANNNTKRHSY